MALKAFRDNGSSVYVYHKRASKEFSIVFDLCVDDLYFMMMENQLWAVECLDKGKSLLIFDGLELVKIE